MPTYVYRCPHCEYTVEEFRSVEDRDDRVDLCPDCYPADYEYGPVATSRKDHPQRIIGYGVQIVASPWYDRAGVFDGVPIGESQKDRLEQRKRDDKENDKSWDGKAPAKSDYQTTGAVDIFKKLTQDSVHKELAGMNEGD